MADRMSEVERAGWMNKVDEQGHGFVGERVREAYITRDGRVVVVGLHGQVASLTLVECGPPVVQLWRR